MSSKRNSLIAATALVGAFTGLLMLQQACDYEAHGLCWKYWSLIGMLGEYLMISVPLFILSLVAYFLREETFRAWLKFVYIWIPLTMLAIFMAPEYGHPFLPITKGSIAGVSSLLFVFISVSIMIFKSFSKKHIK